MKKDAPIFIVGTERSGSNLLRLILNQHPSIAIPHPPHIMKEMMPLEKLYGDLRDDSRFRRLVRDTIKLVSLHFAPWEPRLDEEEIFASAPSRSVYGVKAAIYDAHRDCRGKRRWGCKSTFVIGYVDQVRRVHPNAQFIHLVRDGRDVAVSAKSSVFNHFHPHYVGKLWAEQQRTAIKLAGQLHADSFLTVKYEDLLENAKAAVMRVCGFLGEDYSDALLDFSSSPDAKSLAALSRSWENCAKPILRENRSKFIKGLRPEEIRAFEVQAHEELIHFGYGVENDLGELRKEAHEGLDAGQRLSYWTQETAMSAAETVRSWAADKNAAAMMKKRIFVKSLRLSLLVS